MFLDFIHTLQIGLVASCNARCPFCHRQDREGNPQSHYPKNAHLDLRIFENVLQDPSLDQLKEIFLSGNYGDPMASPRVLELLNIIDRVKPGLWFFLHTNGSLGDPKVWAELGRRLNGNGRFVKFSIDGLKDTNSIYRRGVSWDKIMQNAKVFIDAGGKAIWKFVVFPHNAHQIEEARSLSKILGFKEFQTVRNYAPGKVGLLTDENKNLSLNTPQNSEWVSLDYWSSEALENMEIRCDSQKERTLFLDFNADVWPCCWIGGWKYSSSLAERTKHAEYFASLGEMDFNSLKTNSLSQILENSWFQKSLADSWTEPSTCKGTHFLCASKCGTVKKSVLSP